MVGLLFTIVVLGLALIGFLIAGTFAFQGFFYEEITPVIYWTGPVAGVVLTAYLLVWCLLNVYSGDASSANVPYNTFWATFTKTLVDEPVKTVWVYEKGQAEPVEFVRRKYAEAGLSKVEYVEAKTGRRWKPEIIEAVEIEHQGEKIRFEPRESSGGGYNYFQSADGWIMMDYGQGVSGEPYAYPLSLIVMNLFLNSFHLILWIVCLWLLLRFQFWHAVALGLLAWLITSFTITASLMVQASTLAEQLRTAVP